MYKTVKQGENCLQYTILPQTEEVINNSGLRGKGRDYSPTIHIRKTKRFKITVRFTMVILIMIAAIFIISGIPLYVVVRAFFSDTADQLLFYNNPPMKNVKGTTTQTPNDSQNNGSSHKRVLNEKLYDPVFDGSKLEKNPTTEASTKSVIALKTTRTSNLDITPKTRKPWLMPALKRLLSTSTEVTPIIVTTTLYDKSSLAYQRLRESNTDLMLDRLHYSQWTEPEEVIVKPTARLTPLEDRILQDKPHLKHEQFTTVKQNFDDVLITHGDISEISQKTVDSTETIRMKIGDKKFKEIKDSILDDDDYNDYKDPLVDEDDVQSGSDDVKMSQAKQSWLQNKWPFVDPSSYFQWTGYSAGDNLLLPAILAAAISALFVLGIMFYALRRRQKQARRAQDIGKITSDLQADDNTNLLTADNNMSEDD